MGRETVSRKLGEGILRKIYEGGFTQRRKDGQSTVHGQQSTANTSHYSIHIIFYLSPAYCGLWTVVGGLSNIPYFAPGLYLLIIVQQVSGIINIFRRSHNFFPEKAEGIS